MRALYLLFIVIILGNYTLSAQQRLNLVPVDKIEVDISLILEGGMDNFEDWYYLPGQVMGIRNSILVLEMDDKTNRFVPIDTLHGNFEKNGIKLSQPCFTKNRKAVIFTGNPTNLWRRNDLYLAKWGGAAYYSPQKINFISEQNVSESNPWISPKGDRLYFLKENTLSVSRIELNGEKFSSPKPVAFQQKMREMDGFWISTNEKTIYFLSRGKLFRSKRKRKRKPFQKTVLIHDFSKGSSFVSGVSFSKKMTDFVICTSGKKDYITWFRDKR